MAWQSPCRRTPDSPRLIKEQRRAHREPNSNGHICALPALSPPLGQGFASQRQAPKFPANPNFTTDPVKRWDMRGRLPGDARNLLLHAEQCLPDIAYLTSWIRNTAWVWGQRLGLWWEWFARNTRALRWPFATNNSYRHSRSRVALGSLP